MDVEGGYLIQDIKVLQFSFLRIVKIVVLTIQVTDCTHNLCVSILADENDTSNAYSEPEADYLTPVLT